MAGTRARDKGAPLLSERERAAAAAETGARSSDAMLWPALPNCENVSVARFTVAWPCDLRCGPRGARADGPHDRTAPRNFGSSEWLAGSREIGVLGIGELRLGAVRCGATRLDATRRAAPPRSSSPSPESPERPQPARTPSRGAKRVGRAIADRRGRATRLAEASGELVTTTTIVSERQFADHVSSILAVNTRAPLAPLSSCGPTATTTATKSVVPVDATGKRFHAYVCVSPAFRFPYPASSPLKTHTGDTHASP